MLVALSSSCLYASPLVFMPWGAAAPDTWSEVLLALVDAAEQLSSSACLHRWLWLDVKCLTCLTEALPNSLTSSSLRWLE